MKNHTTISLYVKTKKRLNDVCGEKESYDRCLNRLMDEHNEIKEVV